MEYNAEQGKVWKKKNSEWVGGSTLILAKGQNINDFEQIDQPIEIEENKE